MEPDITQIETARRQAIDRFWETFPPVWHRVRGRIREVVATQSDISVEQFHILRHIRKGHGSVSELAIEKQISRSAISQSVDLLVEKGLVSRSQKHADRRCVELELTEAGNTLLNALFAKNREWMLEKIAALTIEELDWMNRGLDILKRTFGDAENPSS